MAKETAKNKRYKSELETAKRAEVYYPPVPLKKQISEYSGITGISKSELAVRLMKSFFAARKEKGADPTVIVLLP